MIVLLLLLNEEFVNNYVSIYIVTHVLLAIGRYYVIKMSTVQLKT